jgi:molybdopterin-guanine dinucleotide biosynthesis protein A
MSEARATGVVLAGGKSTRLGRDKASELLLGVSLLQRAVTALESVVGDILIVRARGQALPQVAASTALSDIEDAYPEKGPLGGIYTALKAIEPRHALVVGCDMPLLQPALLRHLLSAAPDYDVTVPLSESDEPEPLCAVYGPGCIQPIRRRIEAGSLKVTSFFDEVKKLYLRPNAWSPYDPSGRSFLNMNREADLVEATQLLEGQLHMGRD